MLPEAAITSNLKISPYNPHLSIKMPPRIPRVAIGQSRLLGLPIPPRNQQICPICSISGRLSRAIPRSLPNQTRIRARRQSNLASASTADSLPLQASLSPRKGLRDALANLQKYAASYINISRLQLALRGLDQARGDETIRIAILGQADGGSSLKRAKELLRLLVADPLKTEEEWERILVNDQPGSKPILLKVGHNDNGSEESTNANRMVQELYVSSPILNGHKLELMVLEMDPPRGGEPSTFTEAMLVPTMEIPTSSSGRHTYVTTPVHKSFIVAEGVIGAATVLGYPDGLDTGLVGTAVELKVGTEDEKTRLPFQVLDISLGSDALNLFRKSLDNALVYEQNWYASGVPGILDWVKSGTASTGGEMKEPLHKLIQSVVSNAILAIEAERARQLSVALSSKVSASKLDELRKGVSKWAERAHTELRDQLDVAFEGGRWRKLGWWKLFWRVDDVSMIASEILSQRFLPDAEKETIFVSGCIAQAGVSLFQEFETNWAYKNIEEKFEEAIIGSAPRPPKVRDLIETPQDTGSVKITPSPWPQQIPITRACLSQESVPALQALAQKLVLQTLSASSLASAFAGLIYLSSVSTGLYEAGAVAALGTVWSLRRMQGQWETARKFWEGEVREEGRKAVRAVEGTFSGLLNIPDQPIEVDPDLQKAIEAVNKAKDALDTNR